MTASLLQPGWQQRRCEAGGVQLNLVIAGPQDGPLLILLHGFPEYWWAWRNQIGPLAAARYRVIAPDMRGYNLSDVPHGLGAYHLNRLASDVIALADGLGHDDFHLVGHDWGAIVAWHVAALHPDRIAGLVAINGPPPDLISRAILRHPRQMLRSAYAAFFQFPRLPEALLRRRDFAPLRRAMRRSAPPGLFPREILDAYAAAWRRPGELTAMLNYYRALRLRRPADPPARIIPPTLIMWSERDRFLLPWLGEAALALCEQGRLLRVEGACHWLHLERPDLVTQEILAFLGR
jgi:pimeloyl-ACP methyl ester carboxylesterase